MSQLNIPQNMNQQQMLASELAGKARSKREIYMLLTTECRIYLPSYQSISIYFMKDLMSGAKKWVHCDDVKFIYCPQYEGLYIKDIWQNITGINELSLYFPIPKEVSRLPKQWLINVAYSLCGDSFAEWITGQMNLRNQKVTVEKDLLINLDPRIYETIRNSSSISTQKGIGAQMLKAGQKRRRTKAEIEEQKESEAQKRMKIDEKLKQFEQVQQEAAQLQNTLQMNKSGLDAINSLISQGKASYDENGNFILLQS